MLVALFRLVELLEKQPGSERKVPSGRILIDGVDIATVPAANNTLTFTYTIFTHICTQHMYVHRCTQI